MVELVKSDSNVIDIMSQAGNEVVAGRGRGNFNERD
jgi:hypothetical protein